jgi:site-specific DNA recombinase
MKVALYARVSTKNQEKQGTIASQLEALRGYVKKHSHEVVEDYVCSDEGYSGTLLARPALDRLRDGARAGAFDAVVVLCPDRLSRKYAYLILIIEELERYGVAALFLEQPPADDPHSTLLLQIQGAVAEYERTKIAERYRRGKLYRAKQGEVFWASVPYGYRHIKRQEGQPPQLVINDQEAAVVRKIFAWHVHERISVRQIAKRLTKECIPTPKGGPRWGETTVHRFLRREEYLGTLYYNKATEVSAPIPETGRYKRKRVVRPRSEWIPVSIPQIIERELFDQSQQVHIHNEHFSPRNLHQEQWLLRRLLRCEKCGYKCSCVADVRRPHMPPSYYYRCSKQDRDSKRPNCHPKHMRADTLDEIVWREVRSHLLDPSLLLKAQGLLCSKQPFDQSFLSTQIRNTKKRCDQVEAEKRRLLDIYQQGFLSKDEFAVRARIVQQRLSALTSELGKLEHEYKDCNTENNFLASIADFTTTITQTIDSITFHQRQELLRQVLEEVVIHDHKLKLFFKIPVKNPPLQSPPPAPNNLSSELSLRSHGSDSMQVRVKVN